MQYQKQPAHLKVKSDHSQQLWRNLQYENTPILIYRSLIDVLGSVKAAVLLSQMIYWTRVGVHIEEHDGWFRKTIADLTSETGLTEWEQETARRNLKNLGIIETKQTLVRGITTPWMRVNLDSLSHVMAQALKISANPLCIKDIRTGTDNFKSYLSARIPYHTVLAKIAGGVNAGVMLTCYIHSYFKGFNKRFNGYVTRDRELWLKETGLSFDEQLTARRLLIKNGYITERNMTLSRHIDTRIDLNNCFIKLMAYSDKMVENARALDVCEPNANYLKAYSEETPRIADIQCIEKRAFQSIEKGVSATGKSPHIVTAKALIPNWQKPSYLTGESPHIWTAKPLVYIKYQITISKPQQQLQNQTAQSVENESVSQPIPRNDVVVDLIPIEKQNSNDSISLQDLIFGNKFGKQEQIIARLMLNNIPLEQAQSILDEVSGRASVRNPIAYLRTIIGMARMGTFIPEVAHRVKGMREYEAKQTILSGPPSPANRESKPEPKKVDEVERQRFAKIREAFKGSVRAGKTAQ